MFKMMIVDDEPMTREYVRLAVPVVNELWNVVSECANGAEALLECEKRSYDLIITDIKMPIMDGLGFCEILFDRGLKQRVAILSGYGEFEYAKRAIKFDVCEYLLKPLIKTELADLLARTQAAVFESKRTEALQKSVEIMGLGQSPLSAGNSDGTNIIISVKRIILREFNNPKLSLDYVAEKVGVSPNYLSNIFRKNVGESYVKFLTRVRMERAAAELAAGNKVFRAAEAAGYASVKHFTQVFKQFFGETPSLYQARAKK